MKLYHIAPKLGGDSDNFAWNTNKQWNPELLTMLAGTGNELKSVYRNILIFGVV